MARAAPGTEPGLQVRFEIGFFRFNSRKQPIMKIRGSTFLVSGGGSGLGAATARHFAQAGANVVAADIDQTNAAAVAAEIGPAAVAVKTDVTSTESVTAAIDTAVEKFGRLDGAVNCAGILRGARVVGRDAPHDLDLFRRVIEVNLIGTFNVVRLAAAKMAEQSPNDEGERGVIVNTASVAFAEGQIGQAAYSASKGGVASMTLPIARELARFGIRVVSIAPGVFETSMMAATPEELRDSLVSQAAFPARFGRAEEFAMLARQIVENPMLNGTTLRLDGAMRMGAK